MSKELKKEPIGINLIDEMIQGGLPTASVTGVSGSPGSGKSLLSFYFLLEGARRGQKSVYVNIGEPRRNIDNLINTFDFAKEVLEYEKKGLIVIKCFNYFEYEQVHKELLNKVTEDKKIKRLVVDSFNCFFNYLDEKESNVKKIINSTFCKFREDSLTTLLILEKYDVLEDKSYGIPYLLDGMIHMETLTHLGIIERRMFIPKMRWVNQYKETIKYEITDKGIVIPQGELE